jgi:hypothetical protein
MPAGLVAAAAALHLGTGADFEPFSSFQPVGITSNVDGHCHYHHTLTLSGWEFKLAIHIQYRAITTFLVGRTG